MSFVDDFPSLEDFEVDCRDLMNNSSICAHEVLRTTIERTRFQVQEQIKKHCLDKQKVRGVLNDELPLIRDRLLKKLGLSEVKE